MLADAPADGINTIVGGRFLVHRKVQNKHQQQKSSPRGGRGSKEAENKNSVAPRVRGQKVKRPPIHRVSGVRGSKVFFLLGFNRVSHGASFLAPGSLARRRLARVIHHHCWGLYHPPGVRQKFILPGVCQNNACKQRRPGY